MNKMSPHPAAPVPDFYTQKESMRHAFDQAATSYDAAAVLQREVSQRMAERLDYIKHQPQRILDAGAGTGYGARALLARYPKADLIALDIALGMLQVCTQQAPAQRSLADVRTWLRPQARILPLCSDVEAIALADASVDMIWSNLTIQWCNEPDPAFQAFYRVLQPEGLLMFSTLGVDTLKELRQAFSAVDNRPHVNRFIDMHDVGDALVRAGFATPVMDVEYIQLTYLDAKALMRDLKGIGAHNVAAGRSRGLMGKQAWQRFALAYEAFRLADGLLPASYEVVYGHAWKPSPKPNKILADGSQIIEFKK